jgi:hypothetical protein
MHIVRNLENNLQNVDAIALQHKKTRQKTITRKDNQWRCK